MRKVAILMTCFNRKDKTLKCLEALSKSVCNCKYDLDFDLYLTDDGSTDGTADVITKNRYPFSVKILQGDGNLYWNGGMIVAWSAALKHGGYDGYLWLNNDTYLLPNVWNEIVEADIYSYKKYGRQGIYIGSTKDPQTGVFTYGGFNFVSKLTLKDQFIYPDGNFHTCQCAHGNATYISHSVVKKMGVFCDQYIHGGGDHDYTYLAYKAGFPLIVLKNYVGLCENDHINGDNIHNKGFDSPKLKDRLKYLYSPLGYNLHNSLLFQKRCFPYRYPFVLLSGYLKALFPKLAFGLYNKLRA